MKEIWKDIPGYEGLYKVSDLGNIINNKGRLLKQTKGKCYLKIELWSKKLKQKRKSFSTHQLVAMTFLDHTPCGYELVVDHINNNPLDNRAENLQIITNRENSSKEKKGSSKYPGVYWNKEKKKWRSVIRINRKLKHLGYFTKEEDASKAYQKKLLTL